MQFVKYFTEMRLPETKAFSDSKKLNKMHFVLNYDSLAFSKSLIKKKRLFFKNKGKIRGT